MPKEVKEQGMGLRYADVPVKPLAVEQIETNACSTIYQVGDHLLRLWVVNGGKSAVVSFFKGGDFYKDYPLVDERWANWVEETQTYRHQSTRNPQGPTYDILPDGIKSLYDYVAEMAPRMSLRKNRLFQLRPTKLGSHTFYYYLDKSEFLFEVEILADGRVTCHYELLSGKASTDPLKKIKEFCELLCVSKHWRDLITFILEQNSKKSFWTIDELTEDQFQKFFMLFEKVKN